MSKELIDQIRNINMDKLLDAVRIEHDRQYERAEYYRAKYEEYRKDAEIQDLEARNKDIEKRSLFVMTAKEFDANRQFKERHREKCRNLSAFQYELDEACFGTAITIRCPACGEEKDISDYSTW